MVAGLEGPIDKCFSSPFAYPSANNLITGSVAAPVVYSSYDYGAPLTESRVVRDKMRQIKLLVHLPGCKQFFTRSLPFPRPCFSASAVISEKLANSETELRKSLGIG